MLRRFHLLRRQDISGVSGTGVVADGIELWRGGWVILAWRGRWHTTVLHHQGTASVAAIHGHDGATTIVWGREQRGLTRRVARG